MRTQGGPVQWVQFLLKSGPAAQKKQGIRVLFTFWWYIWKERNKKVFDQLESSAHATASLVQEAVLLFRSSNMSH
jgi:hypothetical protein